MSIKGVLPIGIQQIPTLRRLMLPAGLTLFLCLQMRTKRMSSLRHPWVVAILRSRTWLCDRRESRRTRVANILFSSDRGEKEPGPGHLPIEVRHVAWHGASLELGP